MGIRRTKMNNDISLSPLRTARIEAFTFSSSPETRSDAALPIVALIAYRRHRRA